MPCVIAIDVPEVTNKCFVAYPFSVATKGTYPITEVVEDAIRRSRLDVFWITEETQGREIQPTIRAGITQAKMVVAVCSPGADQKANPNVMYELGLADALAKPTVVVTDDPKALPFDIQSREAFVYQKEELESRPSCEALVNRLVLFMQALMQRVRTEPPVILGDVAGTHALGTTNSLVLQPAFWTYARSAFAYAIEVYNAIESAMPWLDRLNVDARGLCRGSQDALPTFLMDWKDYRKLHLTRTSTALSSTRVDQVRNCLRALHQVAGMADDVVLSSEEDLERLTKGIADHLDRFEPAARAIAEVESGSSSSTNLFCAMHPLQSTAENLMNTANALVRNLVQRICNSFAEGYQ